MTQLLIAGHRVHHGLIGCVLAAFGVGLAYHDRRDFWAWVGDLRR